MATKSNPISADSLRRFMLREARVWGVGVKARRKSLGWTLDQLAEQAGTSPQTIFKIERGQIVARDHLRLAVAFAMGCEPDELFPAPSRADVIKDVA